MTIPLDDKEVMSLVCKYGCTWESNRRISAACKLGCLGIPEFGTDFAMQMVIDTKPTVFFGSGPYCRSVPWYGRMAWKCTDFDRRGKGNDFYCNLYAR